MGCEDLSRPVPGARHCNDDECYDERLLDGLPQLLRGRGQDLVVVLHQKGSHGPAYASRHSAAFSRFGPECKTGEFERCSRRSIQAAYDNTILCTRPSLRCASCGLAGLPISTWRSPR